MPAVAVFTGHMIDRPGRAQPRFPAEREGCVRQAPRRWLVDADVRIGYASAACGSDILFLETVLELGGEANVVLPYRRELFRAHSVDIIPGSDWGERFDRLLGRANVRVASRSRLDVGGISYDYANMVLRGGADARRSTRRGAATPRRLGRASRRRDRGHREHRRTLAAGRLRGQRDRSRGRRATCRRRVDRAVSEG